MEIYQLSVFTTTHGSSYMRTAGYFSSEALAIQWYDSARASHKITEPHYKVTRHILDNPDAS